MPENVYETGRYFEVKVEGSETKQFLEKQNDILRDFMNKMPTFETMKHALSQGGNTNNQNDDNHTAGNNVIQEHNDDNENTSGADADSDSDVELEKKSQSERMANEELFKELKREIKELKREKNEEIKELKEELKMKDDQIKELREDIMKLA